MLRWLLGSYLVRAAKTAACEADHHGPKLERPNGDSMLIQNETPPVEIALLVPPLVEGPVTVLDSLHLALCDIAEARELFKDQLESTKFAFMLNTPLKHEMRPGRTQAHGKFPGKFAEIAHFCTALNSIRQKFPQFNIVICTGNHADAIAHSTFLAASYMLLWEHSTFEQALSYLRPVSAPISALMAAALRAVHQARYLASTLIRV